MEGENLSLATCRQADLERWVTSDDVRHRRETGHFVRGALAQKIARDPSFPAVRGNGPTQAMDDDARWYTACRLPHDDTLTPEDRLAGLLLLLYARWPAAISGPSSTTSRRRTEPSASASAPSRSYFRHPSLN
ncbi:hypothetical protein [Streptomyces roseolilacinus]|uniref:hypothetical protein n=1 Tax=Streptomyces roseolilacinus TaxID=66904 RepID=UPI0037FAB199